MLLLDGCGSQGVEQPQISARDTLPLTSTAFEEGGRMPAEHTCDGEDHSPPLSWSVPPEVSEYALTMVDLDVDFVHWVAFGIPAMTAGLLPAALPEAAMEGTNDFGALGYRGPCPPAGDGAHRYRFTLYALDDRVSASLEPGASYDRLVEAIECCVEVYGTIAGTYERS